MRGIAEQIYGIYVHLASSSASISSGLRLWLILTCAEAFHLV